MDIAGVKVVMPAFAAGCEALILRRLGIQLLKRRVDLSEQVNACRIRGIETQAQNSIQARNLARRYTALYRQNHVWVSR